MTSALASIAIARAELTEADLSAMYRLFCDYFEGSSLEQFKRDLSHKDWIVLLRDADQNCIQGFSTIALYETVVHDQPISVVYSGDTIIRRAYWGTPELPRTWIKTVLEKSAGMPQPLYWLLISSGYKTYRFLSVFYQEFYPHYERSTPPEMQALLDHLAKARFGSDYHPALGIVRFTNGATPLREGVAEVTKERLQDEHVAFYTARNPGHTQGDELVCLTRIHPDNFTLAGKRMAR